MKIKKTAIKIEDENLKRLANVFLLARMTLGTHPVMHLDEAAEFMKNVTETQDLFWGNLAAERPDIVGSMKVGWDWTVGRNAIGEVYVFPSKPFPWAEE